jgi:hypothetical protein
MFDRALYNAYTPALEAATPTVLMVWLRAWSSVYRLTCNVSQLLSHFKILKFYLGPILFLLWMSFSVCPVEVADDRVLSDDVDKW